MDRIYARQIAARCTASELGSGVHQISTGIRKHIFDSYMKLLTETDR